jgi:hypothetical protein
MATTENGSISTDLAQYAPDMTILKSIKTEKEVDELHWMSIELDAEAWDDLRTVKGRFGCNDLTAVKLALRSLSSGLTDDP